MAYTGKHRLHTLPVLRHLRAVDLHVGAGQNHGQITLQCTRQGFIVVRRLGCAKQQVDTQRSRARLRQHLYQLRMQPPRQRRRQAQRGQAGLIDAHHNHSGAGVTRRRQAGQQILLQPL